MVALRSIQNKYANIEGQRHHSVMSSAKLGNVNGNIWQVNGIVCNANGIECARGNLDDQIHHIMEADQIRNQNAKALFH